MEVAVSIAGDKTFMDKMGFLGSPAMFDFRDALEETGKGLKEYFSGQVFDSMGGVFGTPWKALSPSTQAQKAAHYRQYSAVPLMRTGHMRESFVYEAGRSHLEITNTADYFKYHQSTEERKKIPRRPMMVVNKDVKQLIKQAFMKAFTKKMLGL